MALFSMARTDGRSQVAVAATRATGKRHRRAVAAGLALAVEITETQRGAAGVLNDIGDLPVYKRSNGHF